jgi:predicted nuclease of predicted toxin-antitoxin system
MKILADESLDGPIVAWLRSAGHDVVWGAEASPGLSDERLAKQAFDEGRVLITSDRDFGELVFRCGMFLPGAVLLRVRARSAASLLAVFQEQWPTIETRVAGHFVVVGRSRMRVRSLPTNRGP